jgi:hypothetical protein
MPFEHQLETIDIPTGDPRLLIVRTTLTGSLASPGDTVAPVPLPAAAPQLLGGLAALDLYLSNATEMSDSQRGLIMGALGVGAQFGVILPFSRAPESEADVIGMMYMAKAGYPPAESIKVWQRMDELSGSGIPAFLMRAQAMRR